jgi:hypothetical protein
MARPPKFTREEAEALIATERGSLVVTSNNRKQVIQWMTACGVPSAFTAHLTLADMQKAYNDTSDATLSEMKMKAGNGTGADTDATPVESRNDDGSAGATLAKLVAPYLTDGIMNTVLNRVDAILANVSVTRIEVKRVDGSEHVIEGHVHPKFPLLLKLMSARMKSGFYPNVMLYGPTGGGKTHAVHAACKALGIDFETNGALTMDYQVLGYDDANGKYHDTAFYRGYGKPCGYLFDEADASENSPCLAISGALANGQQTFPCGTIARHPESRMIAACNTLALGPDGKFTGRNRLDAAFRSRFPIRMYWGYDEEMEIAISGNPSWARRVQKARAKAIEIGCDVVIDPRMTQAGAALLDQGIDETVVAELTYLSDMTSDQRRMMEGF